MFAVGCAVGVIVDVGCVEAGAGEDAVNGAFLEFDGIASFFDGDVDELFGEVDATVMVDTSFGDDKAGVVGF